MKLIYEIIMVLSGLGVFVSILGMLLGIIKPSLVLFWRKDKTRKKVLFDYTIIIIILTATMGTSIELANNIRDNTYHKLNKTFNNAIEFYETNEYDKALSILGNKQFIDSINKYKFYYSFIQFSSQVDSLKTLCFSSIKEEKGRVQYEEEKNIFYNAKNLFLNGRYEDCLSELNKLSQKSEWYSQSEILKKQSEEKIVAAIQQKIDEDAKITYNKAVSYFNDGFYEDCLSELNKLSQKSEWHSKSEILKKQSEEKIVAAIQQKIDGDAKITYNKAVSYFNDGFYEDCITELGTIPEDSKYYTKAKDLISKSKGMIPYYICIMGSRMNFNLYSISSDINSKIGELYTGDKVEYLEEKSGWYFINSNKFGKGWVETDAINTYPEFVTKMLNDELSKWATLSASVVEDWSNSYITDPEARYELVSIIDFLKEDRDILNNINPPNKFIKAHRYAIDAFNNTINADKEILLGLNSGLYDMYKYLDNTQSAKSSKNLALDILKSY